MRSPLSGRKPADLLLIIAIVNAAMMLSCGVFAVRSSHLLGHQRLPLAVKLPWLLVTLLGIVLSTVAESALNKALATGRWPESQVAPVRKLLDHPAVSILSWSLLAGSIVSLILAPPGHALTVSWLFLFPMTTINRLRLKSRAPSPPAEEMRIARLPAQPLHSSRWGTPAHTPVD